MKLKEELEKLRIGFVKDMNNSKTILKKRYKDNIYNLDELALKHMLNIQKTDVEIALLDYIIENYVKGQLNARDGKDGK